MQKINIAKTSAIIKKHPLWQTAVLASAHMLNDFFSNMLSPLLPILIVNFGMTKFEAGMLNAFFQWPSVSQPFFGRLSDKVNLQKYIFLLPLLTGTFMSMVGVTSNTTFIAISLLIAGICSACFHAVASPMAGKISGKHSGKGLSLWMVGGEMGLMLSPILIIAFVNTFSLQKTPYLIIPSAIISLLLYFRLRKIDAIKNYEQRANGTTKASLKAILPMLLPIIGVAWSRSLVQSVISVYVPTYLTENGVNLWLAGAALSLITGAGVLGTIVGGIYKDKIGGKPVLFISIGGSALFFFLFMYSSQTMQIIALFMTGFFSGMYLPVALSIVQEHSPSNRSFATGIYQAFLFTAGAVATMIIGFLYDRLGAHLTFAISAGTALIGLIFIIFIPEKKLHSMPEGQSTRED